MKLVLKIAPAAEPVTVDEVCTHLRITSGTEDIQIASLITAARQYVESLCGPIITQTWYQYEDEFPSESCITFGKPRVLTLTAVKYTADGAAAATFAASNYTLDIKDENCCRIVLNDNASWPGDDLEEVNGVEIEFTCGYGAGTSDVPEPIRLAILLLVGQWYEARLPVVAQSMTEMPFAVSALLANYRYWGF